MLLFTDTNKSYVDKSNVRLNSAPARYATHTLCGKTPCYIFLPFA